MAGDTTRRHEKRQLEPNVVTLYIEMHGGPTRAAEALSSSVGAKFRPERLIEWENGFRSVPDRVRDWMVMACAQDAISQAGGRIRLGDSVKAAKWLCPPRRYEETTREELANEPQLPPNEHTFMGVPVKNKGKS